MLELLLGGLLVLAIAWLVFRTRKNKAEDKAASQRKVSQSGAFHAVAIKYTDDGCDAAKQMAGRRFLSNAAPRLPLPECNQLECRCSFVHYKDRRAGRDRRSPFARAGSTGATGTLEKERRARTDRRHEDDDDDLPGF